MIFRLIFTVLILSFQSFADDAPKYYRSYRLNAPLAEAISYEGVARYIIAIVEARKYGGADIRDFLDIPMREPFAVIAETIEEEFKKLQRTHSIYRHDKVNLTRFLITRELFKNTNGLSFFEKRSLKKNYLESLSDSLNSVVGKHVSDDYKEYLYGKILEGSDYGQLKLQTSALIRGSRMTSAKFLPNALIMEILFIVLPLEGIGIAEMLGKSLDVPNFAHGVSGLIAAWVLYSQVTFILPKFAKDIPFAFRQEKQRRLSLIGFRAILNSLICRENLKK